MGSDRPEPGPVTDDDPLTPPVGVSADMRLASRASSRGAPAARQGRGEPAATGQGRAMEVTACRR
ncbi:hypothetical protein GCM10009546_21760 [Actinomadura livida]|uniref:Uncharacterized protein n=1 Tax=Actinomadura livida TaxID=79909 RepID=A0ABP3P359_9ACTN|nr:hypothetical protein GCM10010208_03630 [Actinomadura livida]